MTTPSPPAAAVAGQLYALYLNFYDEESGLLADPSAILLDITYGNNTYTYSMDVAGGGPFTYSGATTSATNTIWRYNTGQYGFLWQIPYTGTLSGVYVANWVCTYGSNSDQFLVVEDFPVTGGFDSVIPAGDIGYWSGSVVYSPAWAQAPLEIDFGGVDSNNITWLWQSIQGWDSPPTAGQVIQRSADHGGWPAPQYYGPRIITLNITASAPDQGTRDLARGLLQQAFPVNDLATLTYNEPVPKLVQVRRNATTSIAETYPTLTDVTFTIPLVAPDPRKYETQPQTVGLVVAPPVINPLALPFALPISFPGNVPPSASSLTAINSGTFETRPLITVTGPITGPAIVNANTGEQVSFTGLSLGANDQLVIDMDNRQAYLDGVFQAADVSSAWWVLEPGATQVYLDGVTDGGATLTLTFSSAWI